LCAVYFKKTRMENTCFNWCIKFICVSKYVLYSWTVMSIYPQIWVFLCGSGNVHGYKVSESCWIIVQSRFTICLRMWFFSPVHWISISDVMAPMYNHLGMIQCVQASLLLFSRQNLCCRIYRIIDTCSFIASFGPECIVFVYVFSCSCDSLSPLKSRSSVTCLLNSAEQTSLPRRQ
jgi:hypothetical protein